MSAEDEDRPEPSAKVGYWLSEIKRAQNCQAMRQWHERCIKIRKLYRDEQSADRRKRKYAMLWSNMETMKPSIYAKPPKGVVQRRYKDSDRVGRVASELLERAVNFTFDVNDFDSRLKQVRDDYLLYARGVARLYYEPVMDTVADEDDESGLDDVAVQGPAAEIADDREEAAENENPGELLAFENVKIRYVQRTDFVHQEARTWDEVDWVAFRGYLDRDGLIDRFGEEIGKTIPIEAPSNAQRDMDEPAQAHKAEIWEIWDRCEERVLWICKGYGEVLEEGPPYLKLDGFYPCPRPAYGTLTNDSLAPVPDYTYYQDQVEEIDRLTDRIAAMTEALKLVGCYPAGPQGEGAPAIERAMTPGFENKMIAVKSWAAFTEGGKGGAPIVWLPVEVIGKIIEGCAALRKQLIEDIYQIYGLSDIMRGNGEANETATAQNIKAQFGSVRIRDRQQEIGRFCRDLTRMAAEIVATHFQPETLVKMTNMQLPTQQDVVAAEQQAALQAQQQNQQQMQQAQPGAPTTELTLVDQAVTLHYPAAHWGAVPAADLTGTEPEAATDIVYNSGWWYRVEGDTREYPLPPPDSEELGAADYRASWGNLDGKNFSLTLEEHVFDHEGPSGGFWSNLWATNNGTSRSLALFHYLDADAAGTAANDYGVPLTYGPYVEQTEVGGSSVVRYRATLPFSAFNTQVWREMALFPGLRNRLNDAVVDDFATFPSPLPVGPGDVSAACEFKTIQDLQPGQGIQGSVTVYSNMPSRYVKGAAPDDTPFPVLVYHDTLNYRTQMMRRASMVPQAQDSPLGMGNPVGVDDFDGNYDNDVLYRNLTTGDVWVDSSPLAGAPAPPLNWIVTATGDFNGNGKADILWRNTTTQKLVVWFMDGATRIGSQAPNPDQAVDGNWSATGTGDFNGDGRRDILWYNQTSGKIVIWYMNGFLQRISGGFTDPPSVGNNNWKVVAVGDYGKGPSGALPAVWNATDIVWQNDNSYKIVIWYMDKQARRTSGTFTTPDAFGIWQTVLGPR